MNVSASHLNCFMVEHCFGLLVFNSTDPDLIIILILTFSMVSGKQSYTELSLQVVNPR